MQSAQLCGRVILVVEDEPLFGLEVAEILTAQGANVVSSCRSTEALKTVEATDLSAAVLDISLGSEDCSVVCQRLAERGVPFLFYSGYAHGPDGWAEVPVIAKPAHPDQLVDAVARLCRPHVQAA